MDLMNIDVMSYMLMGFLLLCGYLFLLRYVTRNLQTKKSMFTMAVILLIIYAVLTIPLMIILNQMGSSSFVLLSLMLMMSCVVFFGLVYGLYKHFREANKVMLVLFILYIVVVSYFTIFNREEGHSRAILLRFDSLRDAIRTNSLEPLQHALLNAVMFIPIGILFPRILPSRLDSIIYTGGLGLMLSTAIETTQMLLRIGQCDIEDIAANTLGAILGFVLYKLFMGLFGRHFEEEEDEDEDEEEEEEA